MPRQKLSTINKQMRKHTTRTHRWDENDICRSDKETTEDELYNETDIDIMEIDNYDDVDDNDCDFVHDDMTLRDKIDTASIGDLFELCKKECGSRKLTTLVHMIMRHVGHDWRFIDDILRSIGVIDVK
ncbi:unnamed protein product [Didymodactylos carnosus]|uniref:Uncharacterized protein n=1 Tax=Didymodactylos carnosus TaxID=1234261 RepID=A0A8S2DJU2_9BILA|nr:unnamed protein product [Didymodactylos carnosus]CAF3700494.1 unnamed protein product [Didymodactylos carnosus]